ncbi:MAG TPA: hypothetical protein VFV67_28795 [Actinophytocola sp.]|uniref:hypothetical protein n=1 Tax=Actinophytocola sp. TaxID=1872138 RepID=UPI002DBE03E9|nr:hypothetical protein [Actinophytocola sp.]HEU5474665.1 hypothetical protein [Actinophytocola sp.]
MRLRRALSAGLGLLMLSGTTGLATAAPAQAAATCVLTVKNIDGSIGDEIQVLELQENGGDEIWMELNDKNFPLSGTVPFTFVGQGRPASAFDNPTRTFAGAIRLRVIEDDPVFNDEIGDVVLPCQPLSATLQLINGGTGVYNIEIEIRQISS